MPNRRSSVTPPGKASPRGSSPRAKPSSPPESPETPDGRRARGDATRARVLRAALKIASLQGLDGVTFGQVAEAAGVSKGHLAQLFGDRAALQLAVLDAAVEVFTQHVWREADTAPTALERLRRRCLGWFDYVEGRILPGGCLITAASSEFRTIKGAVHDRLVAFRQRRREQLRSLIADVLAEQGDRRDVNVDELMYQILAYEAAANVASFLEDEPAFAHARRSTAALIEGLARR